jgi:hypothetical protein
MAIRPIGSRRIRHLYSEVKTSNDKDGWKLESHIIAEKKYGRKLRVDEVVHHIDRDRLNNVPDNLVIMTKNEHRRLHTLGTKLNNETKRKMSQSHIGLFRTAEHCKNISKSKMGHGVSAETRKKISNKLKGIRHSEEYKKRHSKIITEWWAKRKQEMTNVGI